MGTLQKFMWLGLAGACGSTARYALFLFTSRYFSGALPWSTITVNGTGCFIFGLIFSVAEYRLFLSGEARIILLVGFVGAFTTFSAVAFETVEFMNHSQWSYAIWNIVLENGIVLIAMFLGLTIGRLI